MPVHAQIYVQYQQGRGTYLREAVSTRHERLAVQRATRAWEVVVGTAGWNSVICAGS